MTSNPPSARAVCKNCGCDHPPRQRGRLFALDCVAHGCTRYSEAPSVLAQSVVAPPSPPAAREPEATGRLEKCDLDGGPLCGEPRCWCIDKALDPPPADRTAEYAHQLLAAVQQVRDCPCLSGASCDALDRLYDLADRLRAALPTEERCPKCGGPTERWQQAGRDTPAIRCLNNGCTWTL